MQTIYYISTLKLTGSFAIDEEAFRPSKPILNETLRPHMENPDEREGDFVHADLEEAKDLARNILLDLGDKGMDVIVIAVDDEVYAGLAATGDIRDCERKDPLGGSLLKLSQRACQEINANCTAYVVRWMLPEDVVKSLQVVN